MMTPALPVSLSESRPENRTVKCRPSDTETSGNLSDWHGRQTYADRYLALRHRDNPGDGCTMAALGPEVARSTPELKAAFEQGLEEILTASGGDRKEAIFQTAAMLGGLVLARAVRDPQFSEEILESVRRSFK